MKAHPTQKIASFAAHEKATHCLKIGSKSARIMVTGGEDKKVNLWAIGKPTSILVFLIKLRVYRDTVVQWNLFL